MVHCGTGALWDLCNRFIITKWHRHWIIKVVKATLSLFIHPPLDKMAVISQTFPNAFSWMKSFVSWCELHWSLFLRVQLTISQHWFKQWLRPLGTKQVTSHYMKQYWTSSLMHLCGTRGKELNILGQEQNGWHFADILTHLGLVSHICIMKNSPHFPSDAYMRPKSLYFSYRSRGWPTKQCQAKIFFTWKKMFKFSFKFHWICSQWSKCQ